MKNTKRCFCNFSYYDQQAIQETLEHMAEMGWMLEKTGSFMWTYKRMEPRRLRFSVTYFPRASEFDPGPTDGELTKIDYCHQDGWILVTSWGVMQIFYNENVNAVPIETEPVTQVENIRRSMRKNVLIPQAIMCAMLLWNLVIRFSQWKRDPIGELSDPASLSITLMFSLLVLACLYEIAFYFRWSWKAGKAAQDDSVFLPIQSKPLASWLLTALSALFLIFVFSALNSPLSFALFWLCTMPLITLMGNFIKKHLKKRGVSRNINFVVSVGSVTLMTFLLLGLMTAAIISGRLHLSSGNSPVGTYELYGRTREIYDDLLPLEIEDLAEVNAQWSKEADPKETFLLSSTEYRQYAIPVGENDAIDERELEYTVTEVKWNFLYDFVKQAVLNSRQDEIHGDYVLIDHYEPVDAGPWNAGEVYQRYWGDGDWADTYLIFQEDCIIYVKFSWKPRPEQIAITAEKLNI